MDAHMDKIDRLRHELETLETEGRFDGNPYPVGSLDSRMYYSIKDFFQEEMVYGGIVRRAELAVLFR
jgi:hypothetical protein